VARPLRPSIAARRGGAWLSAIALMVGCAASGAGTSGDSSVGTGAGAAPTASTTGAPGGSSSSSTAPSYPPLDVAAIGAPTLLVGDLGFSEGPLWDAATSTLLFTDLDADRIDRLALPSTVTVLREPSHGANGLAFDRAGRLVVAEQRARAVTRTRADGVVETLASAWEGAPLNSPNDLVVRPDGTIYFTDPTYGLGPAPSALGFTGLYRIDPAGALHLEAKMDGQPNGVDLAPGEAELYVAATTAGCVHRFAVAADGALSGPTKLADVDAPDGLAVDAGGNLYVAALEGGQGAVVVLDAKGTRLGAVKLATQPTNVAFGGAGARTLFVTARPAIYSIAVPFPGR
jgi:gluconolactonase